MKTTKTTKPGGLRKVIGVSALALTLATTAFMGVGDIVFALETQPESLPTATNFTFLTATQPEADADLTSSAAKAIVANEYQIPSLNAIWDDNEGYANNQPQAGAMSYEEAAQIGARYIWEMTGKSIEGKTVQMLYANWPHSTKTYWLGTVVNQAEDLVVPDGTESKELYTFRIDAVTGEWVSIQQSVPSQTGDRGAGKTVTGEELQALQNTPPAQLDELSAVARDFAQKHFTQSTVADVKFVSVSYPIDRASARAASQRGDTTITIYEKDASITFRVTDDAGRVATVYLDVDTQRGISLDSSDSDFVPGYSYDAPGGIG